MKACAVLFSGGLDSTTTLYWSLARYEGVSALTFDYGQRHRVEVAMARRVARRLGVPHVILRVDPKAVGGSALTDSNARLPRAVKPRPGPPSTYVPFRNGVFLAMAAAWAESRGVRDLVCGFHTADSPDYPDTTRTFVRAMERAVNAGTRAAHGGPPIRILAPFIGLSKAGIIRRGLALGADYAHAISCYAGGEVPCGECSSCRLRAKAWHELGLVDPLLARLRKEGNR